MFHMMQVCSRRSVQRRAAHVNQVWLFTGAALCCDCPNWSDRVNLSCLTLPNGPAKLSRDIVILQRDFSTLLHQWRLAG